MKDGQSNLKLNFDYKEYLEMDLINYKKSQDVISSIFLDLSQAKGKIQINEINFQESKNIINIKGLILKNYEFLSYKEILVKTKNNNFVISNNKRF